MGLLTGILGLPLAPARGVVAVADQILRQAEEQYYDPDRIRQQLEQIERSRAAGEISDEDAAEWEDILALRLVEGQRRDRRG
jgi:hypothetical protein